MDANSPNIASEPETAFAATRQKTEKVDVPTDKMSRCIDAICKLKQGWDGFNAVPVTIATRENFCQIINACNQDDLSGWDLYPEINGTLMLQNDSKNAGINIGDTEFSYFVVHGDNVSGLDNVRFSVPTILETIRNINGQKL